MLTKLILLNKSRSNLKYVKLYKLIYILTLFKMPSFLNLFQKNTNKPISLTIEGVSIMDPTRCWLNQQISQYNIRFQ